MSAVSEATRELGGPGSSLPPFEAFYRALNRREPLPWQARLARQVAENGEWPGEIGLPTGLGKTACLEIAVWWLASQAHRTPERRTAPTRIWWVVNRRLLVDAVTDHAEFIGRALADPASQGITGDSAAAVSVVGDRLRWLAADSTDSSPLEVIRLRGGVATRRPVDPSKPAILLSTLPMYGSRLLFRGYGSTRSMRPVDAALAGTDSLVMLDEAHLVPHLRALIADLGECTPDARPILPEGRTQPRLVALTATGDIQGSNRFALDAEDHKHSIVMQRLDAAKPIEIRVFEAGDASPHLAKAALDLLDAAGRPSACLVFANTPATARSAFTRLIAKMSDSQAEIVLLTGLVRDHEAERIRDRVLHRVGGMAANRNAAQRHHRHLIVVATQTLEVGADIDAEHLVTEACGVRALTQRLGRLNRLGRFVHARGIYVHCPPRLIMDLGSWPVYGTEPVSVLARLQATGDGSPIALSPRRVARVLGTPADDPGRAPQIMPGILREWTKTTTPPDGEAPVEPYFSGISGAEHRVSVIWRSHVPEDGEWLWPRPAEREVITLPRRELRDALDDDERVSRLDSDGVTIRVVATSAISAGDTVVLASDRGLMDAYGWNHQSSEPVMDLSMLDRGVPLHDTALKRLGLSPMGGLVHRVLGFGDDAEDLDEADQAKAFEEILSRLSEATPAAWTAAGWHDFVGRLRKGRILKAQNEIPWALVPEFEFRSESRNVELDETSLVDGTISLDQHGNAVGRRAAAVAGRLGVRSAIADIVEQAGQLHDIGKADRRFQLWLDPTRQHGFNVAKSTTPRHLWDRFRVAANWPRGGRHEALSARLGQRWLECRGGSTNPLFDDLLVHLIISHHGSGRPLVRPVSDGTPALLSITTDGHPVEIPADLAETDWGQPARFLRLSEFFGHWTLALLEAIIRQSDHAVSGGLQAE